MFKFKREISRKNHKEKIIQNFSKNDKKVLTFMPLCGIIRMYQETDENNIYFEYIN